MRHLHLQVPINSLGYGVVGWNLYKQLTNQVDLTLWPIGNIQPPTQPDKVGINGLKQDIGKQDEFSDPEMPTLKVWHENQLAERIGKGSYYAYPFFEVNKFDSRRLTHLRSVDELIVSSLWAKNIIVEEAGFDDDDVFVVSPGVDRDIFNPIRNQQSNEKCVFFNCGKWEVRKGHDILAKAFKDAFPNREPVELWMMTSNPFLNEQETWEWENKYGIDSRIKLLNRVQYQEDLANIMGQTFCGVFPARAEGWNLELLEMMSMGKVTIATNYSAHTEFCSTDNCLLIDYDMEPMYDGKWFQYSDATWAAPKYDSLVNQLRVAYEVWKDNPYYENKDAINTAKYFTWERAANRINNIIFHEEVIDAS